MRGILFKRLRRGDEETTVSLTTFPFRHFASGHTFFSQAQSIEYVP